MKKIVLSILFVVAIVSMLFAQTPQMTYQAVIRDGNGQLITNRSVEATVKVRVGESELFNQTYTETTNMHGLLTVTFGDAGFATIDWANASISCEVKNGTDVYIAENFQPVTTVPLAIKAISESDPQFNASVASDITAADTVYWNHKLDAEVDGSVTNEIQALSISKDTVYLSNGGYVKLPEVIDSTSLDAAYNHGHSITADDGPVTINGTDGFLATGSYGSGPIPASGEGTRMMWYPGKAAFRAGYIDGSQWNDENVGRYSTAMGINTMASGSMSNAMGYNTSASGQNSTAMGYATTASGYISTAMGENTIASGIGSTAMGSTTTASGANSIAMGYNTKASNRLTVAMGHSSEASGDISFAMGSSTKASGYNSTAMGGQTIASGNSSTAMGTLTTASGNYSTAMGDHTNAQAFSSVVLGRYNVVSGDSLQWVSTDPLFVIGNGASYNAPSNALTVYKNGNMDVNGIVTATGGNSTNWNDAYNWGNHATAGYLAAEVDGSVTNEIQTLSISKDTVYLSNGGFVKLPAVIDSTSLDAAYNHGHSITADDGPVTINGTDGFLSTGELYNGMLPVSGPGNRMMWHPRKAAFRAGLIDGTQWDDSNVGWYSTAMGNNTTAVGSGSTAMGHGSTASGTASTALGFYTNANASFSTAMGYSTTASGTASTALGWGTTASNNYSTAMGFNSLASGYTSIALGDSSIASGPASIAMGIKTIASGPASTAMGTNTIANQYYSTAMGFNTRASGNASTSMGSNTIANGWLSAAFGELTKAQSYASVVLGRNNVVSGDSLQWVLTDPLFVIGNGTDFTGPSNALTVYKNGNMDVNGIVTATGGNSTNWNDAYNWGNHATAGYLTSFTEVDGSVTNEIQALSISKDTVYLSNGGFVKLPTADGAETIITAGTNVTVTGNGTTISPYVVNATVPTTLSIGQSYQGGIIFWLDATGQHGLIAATADQSTGVQWYNGTYRYTGTTGDGLYAGAMNTALIVATQMSDNQTGNFAAKVCADYSVTENGVTYGDWYLPSKYELNLLYFQKDMVFGFASAYYWSSTESYDGGAWGQYFVDGSQIDIGKSNPSSVRAIRSF